MILQRTADQEPGTAYLFIPSNRQNPKFREQGQCSEWRQRVSSRTFLLSQCISLNQVKRLAKHSPLENFFCLLFRYLDSQVPQGLHDLLSIDSSCNDRGRELGARPTENPRPGLPLAPEATLTIVLFVQTLEHQPQFLLVILEIMDKLFKVQLPIKVFITSLYNFLENKSKVSYFNSCISLCLIAPCSQEITVPTHEQRCPQ